MINYQSLFYLSTTPCLIIGVDLTVLDVNEQYLKLTNRQRVDLIGRTIFDAFAVTAMNAETLEAHRLYNSIHQVLATGKPETTVLSHYPVGVALPIDTGPEKHSWSIVNTPLFDQDGRIYGLSHCPTDLSLQNNVRERLKAASLSHEIRLSIDKAVAPPVQSMERINRVLDAERRRLLDLFDQAPGFIYLTRGPHHIFELGNKKVFDMVGNRNLAGKPIRDAFPELEGQGVFELLDQAFHSGKPYVAHNMRLFFAPRADSEPHEVYLDFVYQPVVATDGSVSGIFAIGHDVTELKQVVSELRLNNERWNFVLQGSGDAYWDWNLVDKSLMLSKRWYEILGLEQDKITDGVREVRRRLHPDDQQMVYDQVAACLAGRCEDFSCEYRLRAADGHWKWVHGRGKVVSRSEDGRPLRMTGTVTDISEKRRSAEQIWRQANFDGLTGLPNRALFRDRLVNEVKKAERSGAQFALLFIDLDHFKEANDLLGHDIGDVLLTRAAERITASVRASDTVARLGGDEFTVILTELDDTTLLEPVAEKILDALSKPFCLGEETLYLSASIGITLYPTDAQEPEDLVRNADQAMYVAKRAGRNQYRYFTASLQERARSRLRLIAELRDALAAHEFRVYFQPIIDLRERRITKAEALLRWSHPTRGLFYPSDFIGLAEETGLIHEIGNWVFTQSALWSQRWSHQLGMPFQISVNTSPVQFHRQDDQVDWVQHLNELGMSRNCISIEITEGVLLNASPVVSERLLEFRDAGIQVALDDFGTGYSSMAYLKKFDIDYLKIDQSFVADMTHNQGSRTITETIIVMAHKLGLKVIAEGIETEEQRAMLVDAGCDYGQGFLFSKALAPQELEPMLQRRNFAM